MADAFLETGPAGAGVTDAKSRMDGSGAPASPFTVKLVDAETEDLITIGAKEACGRRERAIRRLFRRRRTRRAPHRRGVLLGARGALEREDASLRPPLRGLRADGDLARHLGHLPRTPRPDLGEDRRRNPRERRRILRRGRNLPGTKRPPRGRASPLPQGRPGRREALHVGVRVDADRRGAPLRVGIPRTRGEGAPRPSVRPRHGAPARGRHRPALPRHGGPRRGRFSDVVRTRRPQDPRAGVDRTGIQRGARSREDDSRRL